MSHVRVIRSALSLTLLASCGGGHAAPDARPDVPTGPCWPLDAMPGGQAELGTGDITFEAMPAMLPIVQNGSQSDPFLQIHSRIHGLPPGNPSDILDPGNPKTKVGATIDELGLTLGVECPASLGYVASPEAGAFDLIHSLRVGFGTMPLDQLAGKQVRITLEVVGSNGLYAQDTKMATLTLSSAAN
jgi:hypothetical protein